MSIYKTPYEQFQKLDDQELRGCEGMNVSLVSWPEDPYYAMMLGQSASWRPWKDKFSSEEVVKMLDDMISGKIWMGQVFESINFTFKIENISRATTHQIVRTRVGFGAMQESGREGTWDKAPFITPLTILEQPVAHMNYVNNILTQIHDYRQMQERWKVPPQDARFVFCHAVAQNLWATYNFRALLETANKRLCCNMQWEVNTVFRMIRDAVLEKFPHLGVLIKSHCEREGEHKQKDNTNYYKPGAINNGNKVYFELEGMVCGKAGKFSEEEIELMLKEEKNEISKRTNSLE